MKEKGMTLISKKTVNFKSKDATYITLSQMNNGTVFLKQMLMFPSKDGTVMINGIYPEAHKGLEDEMSRAIFTTRYDEGRSENPEDAVPFSIDVKGTDFKHVKYMSGMLLYSFEDKMPTNKPILIVGSSIDNVTGDREAYARNRIKQLPNGEHNDIKEIKEITIDKLHGFETEAYGRTKDNKQERIYQVILFDADGSYYMISAQEQIDFENHLPVFKKVARSFRRK